MLWDGGQAPVPWPDSGSPSAAPPLFLLVTHWPSGRKPPAVLCPSPWPRCGPAVVLVFITHPSLSLSCPCPALHVLILPPSLTTLRGHSPGLSSALANTSGNTLVVRRPLPFPALFQPSCVRGKGGISQSSKSSSLGGQHLTRGSRTHTGSSFSSEQETHLPVTRELTFSPWVAFHTRLIADACVHTWWSCPHSAPPPTEAGLQGRGLAQ